MALKIKAFFQLVRWPNMVFIALTQWLFYHCIIEKKLLAANVLPNLDNKNLPLLIFASVCIAAAGNIINDYFDINIDRINKPNKVIIGKIISRRWAIIWHILLSSAGVATSFYLDFTTPIAFLGWLNLACVLLLFAYSITFKKQLLSGNILISLLTAWVVVVLSFCELSHLTIIDNAIGLSLSRLTFLYAGFACIISIIREAIKDMEDVEGDERYGCKTMPIVWGIQATKVFVSTWLIVLIVTLAIVQVYALQKGWWHSVVYCVLAVLLPLVVVLYRLFAARQAAQFHALSSIIKLAMLTGILSMVFFYFYY
jgi:4-hydroxybenzoate polyprenyltransferase